MSEEFKIAQAEPRGCAACWPLRYMNLGDEPVHWKCNLCGCKGVMPPAQKGRP